MSRALPKDAAELFRVAPEEFVAARNALVKRLQGEGRGDDADAVKALRKPTLVVWALNQLAVRAASDVEALLDAGRELRAAQQAAVSSRGAADRLRAATAARREVVSRLASAASDALSEAGRGGSPNADQLATALEAASIDDDVGERLAAGMLETLPVEVAGFGDVFGLTSVPGGGEDAATEPGTPEPGASPGLRATASPGSQMATADAQRLRREHEAAAKTARRDREAADRAARRLEEQRTRFEQAERDLEAASAKAGASELEARRLERELARATEGSER